MIPKPTLDQILVVTANHLDGPAVLQDFTEHASQMAPDVGDGTVESALELFMDEIRAGKSKETTRKYCDALSIFRTFCKTRSLVSLTQITRQELLKFITYLRNLRNKDGKNRLSDRSVHHHLLISAILLKASGCPKLLEKRDWPKYTEPPIKFYTVEEVKKLRAAAAKMNHSGTTQLLVDFLLGTGFRKGEARHATYSDVDFTGKVIYVTPKPQYNWTPKTSETRTVPIPDELVAALAERRKHANSELLFPTDDGSPLGRNTMTRWINAIGKKAGLQTDADCHTFRRTFATSWLKVKDIKTVSQYLGHSSIETTNRYLDVVDVRGAETRENTAKVYEEMFAN